MRGIGMALPQLSDSGSLTRVDDGGRGFRGVRRGVLADVSCDADAFDAAVGGGVGRADRESVVAIEIRRPLELGLAEPVPEREEAAATGFRRQPRERGGDQCVRGGVDRPEHDLAAVAKRDGRGGGRWQGDGGTQRGFRAGIVIERGACA